MSNVLMDWEQSITIKNVERVTDDFVTDNVVTSRTQLAVVQVAKKSDLNSVTINWALKYLMVHSRSDMLIDEYIEFDSADYKIIERGEWNQYGYLEVVAEQTKLPLITE